MEKVMNEPCNILIIDMIQGFTNKGPLASLNISNLIAKQVDFLKRVDSDSRVYFACDAHKIDDVEFERHPVHCLDGTDESLVCPELIQACIKQKLEFNIVRKRTYSAFFQTDHLEKIGDRLPWIIFGCVTEMCILANVFEMLHRGWRFAVAEDLTGTFDADAKADEINTFVFDILFPRLGVQVVKTTI